MKLEQLKKKIDTKLGTASLIEELKINGEGGQQWGEEVAEQGSRSFFDLFQSNRKQGIQKSVSRPSLIQPS